MDVEQLAKRAVQRRLGRAGRRFKGPEAIKREVDAAGKPPSAHSAFNYATGSGAVTKAAELLQLLQLKENECGDEV